MIGWLIALVYVVVGVVVARLAFVAYYDWKLTKCSGLEKSSYYHCNRATRRHSSSCDAFGSNVEAMILGVVAGLFWPTAWLFFPGRMAYRFIIRPTPGEQRLSHEQQLEKELAELKAKAKELGLPL